jgi:hypothetical protein
MFLVRISAKKQGSGEFFFCLSQSNKLSYSLVRKIHAILHTVSSWRFVAVEFGKRIGF